ncbi:hypothetical protein N8553_02600 [bacterium]|nr:hypothetical protein [bacterium]
MIVKFYLRKDLQHFVSGGVVGAEVGKKHRAQPTVYYSAAGPRKYTIRDQDSVIELTVLVLKQPSLMSSKL